MADLSSYGGDIGELSKMFSDSLDTERDKAKRYVQYGLAGTPLAQSSAMNYGLADALNPFSKATADYTRGLTEKASDRAYDEQFKLADLLGTYKGQDTMAKKNAESAADLANAQFNSTQTGQQYKYDTATGKYVPVTVGTQPAYTQQYLSNQADITSKQAEATSAAENKKLAIDAGYNSYAEMKAADPEEVSERLKYVNAKPGATINTDTLGYTPDSTWRQTDRSNIWVKK